MREADHIPKRIQVPPWVDAQPDLKRGQTSVLWLERCTPFSPCTAFLALEPGQHVSGALQAIVVTRGPASA